ncbi:DNA repair protein RadA [Desulfovibrio litoralis]|uniref:DNA repair protein RadA n=1 Tax=Desulfovibrio litoralis DSM 11393 TaxID=1121455 RepID=A0A1M7SAV8_9BACT|nr:DNA repair protein RadA [Desulfovibrio litoralis]SHN55687.1 DNA replication and repair protein RadA [Desulfovibrio litoralis DSM 11393]
MAKLKEIYLCTNCGTQHSQWKGQCSQCKEWNTLELSTVSTKRPPASHASNNTQTSCLLSEVSTAQGITYSCGLEALDRILGKGLIPGAAVLVGGEPGIGKSTLLLQVAGAVSLSGKQVLYFSGEESLVQIRSRAERLGMLNDNLFALASSQVEDAFNIIEGNNPPALMIVDSIQTLSSQRAEGLAGNVGQVRAVASELMERCKKSNTTLVLVGHVTKEGVLAGPRLIEHMVDTVISLEGDRRQMFRLLRVLKNRFGPNQELLIFQMEEKGLALVEDPSTYFLGARDASLSGTALALAIDGQRTLAVEVQALAARSFLTIPRRAGLGIDVNRLHLILAVLEKRLKLNFAQTDLYAKVGAGLKLSDPALDLAIVVSILSSFYDIPLPERAVFWGELDLNGQIRPVPGQNLRLDQAKRLGYDPIIHPPDETEKNSKSSVSTLQELQAKFFAKKPRQNQQ